MSDKFCKVAFVFSSILSHGSSHKFTRNFACADLITVAWIKSSGLKWSHRLYSEGTVYLISYLLMTNPSAIQLSNFFVDRLGTFSFWLVYIFLAVDFIDLIRCILQMHGWSVFSYVLLLQIEFYSYGVLSLTLPLLSMKSKKMLEEFHYLILAIPSSIYDYLYYLGLVTRYFLLHHQYLRN